jgi:lysophospholipase L1-like esterase
VRYARAVQAPPEGQSDAKPAAVDGPTVAPTAAGAAFGGKTTAALAVALLLLGIPYSRPQLKSFRVVQLPWETQTEESEGAMPTQAAPAPTVGEATLKASENRGTETNSLPATKAEALDPGALAKELGSVAVDQVDAMDAFYRSLARTLGGTAPSLFANATGAGDAGALLDAAEGGGGAGAGVTRILHYGDSVITSDYVSGTMRRKMQARFGDAGHGFILAAKGWEWYFHNDVSLYGTEGWTANRITGPLAKDGMYGLGGVVFHATPGASATFGPASMGDYGRKVGRYDLYYLEHPQGGDLELKVTGGTPEVLSTKGDAIVSRVKSIEVPDGDAKFVVRSLGKGDNKVFGVALERNQRGVTYDALGALGARAKLWDPMNAEHWKEQMALRKPALIVIQFGTNESEDGGVNVPEYEKTLGGLIDKLREAAPNASILVAAPLDRAVRSNGELKSDRTLVKIVGIQERVAQEKKVAFWNAWKAMGGEGAMGKWLNAKPQLCSGDLTHPTPAGAEVLGDLFYKALTSGYEAWQSAHTDAPKLPAIVK